MNSPTFHYQVCGAYEISDKLHLDMYTLKLWTNFVTHPTFHILKLKLFLHDDQGPDWKLKVWPKVDAIEHRLVAKIGGIFYIKQTQLRSKEYLVKYKPCHHKEAVWMKPNHLDHLPEMVNKFAQEWGHELGVKKTWKKKRNPFASGLGVDENINV